VNIELINTGAELLLGQTLNTHQLWLGQQLAEMGQVIGRQMTVPDTAPEIAAAVREALSRADVVLTTGGLGPTSDDATRETIAALLNRTLHENATVLAHIREIFATRRRPMPESTRVQALVPEGAQVLANPNGTAPGLAFEIAANPFREGRPAWLILLPGPPRELRPMFTDTVKPMLRQIFAAEPAFYSRTLRTVGLGESMVAERVVGPLAALVTQGLELGYCAHSGAVDLRLGARGDRAEAMVHAAERIARELFGANIFGAAEESLEAVVLRLLTERQQTLALAESCTGGFIAHRLTNLPGASAVLLAGLVTYANAAKEKFLGVRPESLQAYGAVSATVAREMAEGARRQTGADYALAVTGIAGPGGGTPEKPVGTVFLALATPTETVVQRRLNLYDRETFKEVTARQAWDLLRRAVLGLPQDFPAAPADSK